MQRRLARAGDAARRAGTATARARKRTAGGGGRRRSRPPRACPGGGSLGIHRLRAGAYDQGLTLMIDGANELERADPRAAAILLTNAATIVQHRLDLPGGITFRRARLATRRRRRLSTTRSSATSSPSSRCWPGACEKESSWRGTAPSSWKEAPEGRLIVADAASTLLYMGECAAARRLLERAIASNRAAGARRRPCLHTPHVRAARVVQRQSAARRPRTLSRPQRSSRKWEHRRESTSAPAAWRPS